MTKAILIDFIKFLKEPDDRQMNLNFRGKIHLIAMLLIMEIIITFTVILPILTKIEEILPLQFNEDKYTNYDTFLKTMIITVITVPFFEELVFRYFLRYKGFKIKVINYKRWQQIFPYLVYGFSISFGLLHVSNYSNNSGLFFLLSPIIILSQLIGGIILSYIRVRLNFLYGLMYHWIWNLITAIIIPFILILITNPFTDKNEQYTITIEEKAFYNREKQNLVVDSINSKVKYIKANHYSIKHIVDTITDGKTDLQYDELVNLEFKSDKGVTKEEFVNIVRKVYKAD